MTVSVQKAETKTPVPPAAPPPDAEQESFVINLCSSTTPMALTQPQLAELKRYKFFVSRRLEDGRERFRLHMGYFDSLPQAEELLPVVRDIYPGAWAGEAPGKRLRCAGRRATPLPRLRPVVLKFAGGRRRLLPRRHPNPWRRRLRFPCPLRRARLRGRGTDLGFADRRSGAESLTPRVRWRARVLNCWRRKPTPSAAPVACRYAPRAALSNWNSMPDLLPPAPVAEPAAQPAAPATPRSRYRCAQPDATALGAGRDATCPCSSRRSVSPAAAIAQEAPVAKPVARTACCGATPDAAVRPSVPMSAKC